MLNPVADELVEVFNIRYGYSNAPQAMADELIQAQLRIFALERRLEKEELDGSYGFKRGRFAIRRCPYEALRNPPKQPKPQLADPITDDWTKTGATGDAS